MSVRVIYANPERELSVGDLVRSKDFLGIYSRELGFVEAYVCPYTVKVWFGPKLEDFLIAPTSRFIYIESFD